MTRRGELAAAVAAAAALAAGCGDTAGTIEVELTTAPGSTLLDGMQHLRLTITAPRSVVEADRGPDGFDLALEVDAAGVIGALIVEGFDAGGALIAAGQSPGFPVAALNARIVVYMAPPMSIGRAPVALAPVARGVASAALSFGAIFAGGSDAAGAPSAAIAIYNAFDHTLGAGEPMPAPRSELQLGVGVGGGVFLYGGLDAGAAATATLLRFDTTVAPDGSYASLGEGPLPRAGQRAFVIGPDHFLISGAPVIDIDRLAVTARGDIAALPAQGAAGFASDGAPTAVFAGTAGIQRFRDGALDTVSPAARTDAGVAAIPGGKVVVIGGSSAGAPSLDAEVVDAATGAVVAVPGALQVARAGPAVAATARHIVIAGGVDGAGAPVTTAEVLDATTLAHLASIAYAPASSPTAIALPNDQVLLQDAATLMLFTPPPP